VVDPPFPPPGLEDEGSLRKPVLGYALGVGAIGLVNAVGAKVVIESGGLCAGAALGGAGERWGSS